MLLGKLQFLYFNLILIRPDLDYSGIESAIDSRFDRKKKPEAKHFHTDIAQV